MDIKKLSTEIDREKIVRCSANIINNDKRKVIWANDFRNFPARSKFKTQLPGDDFAERMLALEAI